MSVLPIDHVDFIELLDTLYDGAMPADARARHALDVVLDAAHAHSGAVFRFHSGFAGARFALREVDDVQRVGPGALWTEATVESVLALPLAEQCFGRTMTSTLSELTTPLPVHTATPGWDTCWTSAIRDVLGVISRDAGGRGVALCIGLEAERSLLERERRLLTRIATHVGASERLSAKRSVDTADVVLSPNGKLLHAAEPARIPDVRDGVARRAFARKSRHDAERALDAWQGLVDGTWSIVDHFDTDGKRFVLAVKNAPEVAPRAALAPHDRRVAALAAMGHRDKEISYSLGITMGSVAAALRRARKALRVKTRAELAVRWRQEP